MRLLGEDLQPTQAIPEVLQDLMPRGTFLSQGLKSAGPGRAQGSGNLLLVPMALALSGILVSKLQLDLSQVIQSRGAPGSDLTPSKGLTGFLLLARD